MNEPIEACVRDCSTFLHLNVPWWAKLLIAAPLIGTGAAAAYRAIGGLPIIERWRERRFWRRFDAAGRKAKKP